MKLMESVALGIVQGLTEFLPVSSSAHLLLVPAILKWKVPSVLFIACLHLGTFLACLIYFRRDVIQLCVSFFTSLSKIVNKTSLTSMEKLVWLILASTFPTAFFGLLFKDAFESLFENTRGVSVFLLCTAVILFAAERWKKEKKTLEELSFMDAFLVGLAQTVSIAPGISRSGACLSSAVLLGLSKKDAARYAFLLALPAIAGAVIVEGMGALKGGSSLGGNLFFVAAGILASFISGMFAIDFFIKKVKQIPLSYFSAYCVVFGVSSLLLLR